MQVLSKTQQDIFEYIREIIDSRGVAPTVREIGGAVGLKSTSSVQYNLNALEDLGYIQRDPNLKRTIRICSAGTKARHIPLVGTVAAGNPILATQSIEEYIPVAIRGNVDNMFALRVKGDSMINAAILDGDIVVVECTPVADNGDIVVALIDEEATVKRYFKENGGFRLQPENDSYAPIIVKELTILGKVKMVLRSL